MRVGDHRQRVGTRTSFENTYFIQITGYANVYLSILRRVLIALLGNGSEDDYDDL